jgi:hypothetical protein
MAGSFIQKEKLFNNLEEDNDEKMVSIKFIKFHFKIKIYINIK